MNLAQALLETYNSAAAVLNSCSQRDLVAAYYQILAAYYRGKDANTGKYSKRAFDLLHSRYPESPWTVQTPYWYN